MKSLFLSLSFFAFPKVTLHYLAIPVILDTAIGNSIDDSLALACTSPEIRLLGVTTTYNEPHARAVIARRLLARYGMAHVPVAAGTHPRYERKPVRSMFALRRLAYLEEMMAREFAGGAEDLIAEKIFEAGRAVIVATGPLTNVVSALRRYPELESKIEKVVFMGGWPSQGLPEHNIREDPHALKALLHSRVDLVAVGYEVTLSCVLRYTDLLRLEATTRPGLQFLLEMYRTIRRESPYSRPILHDPIAVALLCRPDLVTLPEKTIGVEERDTPTFGAIYYERNGGRRVLVCTAIDRDGYLDFLIDRISLDEFARHVGVSKFHFARSFKEAFGISPLGYHRSLRMERAKLLLRLGDLSIREVARRSGYSTLSAFCTAFRKEVGMSPSQYRASNR